MATQNLGSVAAEAAEHIEMADSARDAGLVGDGLLGVELSVAPDGHLRDITVSFNAHSARISVDLSAGMLTASAGFDTHRVHINDDAEAVLREAFDFHASTVEGVEIKR